MTFNEQLLISAFTFTYVLSIFLYLAREENK